jgi:hypothetical protein
MVRILVAILLFASPLAAQAEAPEDTLSSCLADNTSAKNRRDLARWLFFAMAAHPEIKQYVNAAALEASEEAHKNAAATFTRLVTESRAQQTQAAFKAGGTKALEVPFRTLGQLAMQELMSNREVSASMSAFDKYIDRDKLNQVLGGK